MQGKLSPRVPRRRRDWRDTVYTHFCVRDSCTEAEVMAMTPEQRKAVQEQYAKESLERFNRRKAERDSTWLAWNRSNSGPLTWKSYCEVIGRPDLFRNECLTDLRSGAGIAADHDYEIEAEAKPCKAN
jgi:hypothetical protein